MPSWGLKSVHATAESSSFVMILTTAAAASWNRVTVLARPGCGAWPEQEGSQLGDRERIEVGVEAAITRAVETGRDGVVDENRPADLAKRDCAECAARVRTHVVVSGTADREVALLESVGEQEELSQRTVAHWRVASTFGPSGACTSGVYRQAASTTRCEHRTHATIL